MKKKLTFTLLLLLAVLFLSSAFSESWSQINQPIQKREGWRQIVDNSIFTLGESIDIVSKNGKIFAGKSFTEKSFGTYPSIDGSTVMVPMAIEFARQHLRLSEADLSGFVAFSTTHNAYLNLIHRTPNGSAALVTEEAVMDASHPVDLMIGTEPSSEELALAQERGVALIQKPICYDAFVFITHVSNPVESLPLSAIRSIYKGEIINWEELGGNDAEIEAYQRNQNAGSQTAMENRVMQGEPIFSHQPVGIYFVGEMSLLVSKIGGYESTENGIGYTYKYYLDELYRDDSIKILSIDGIYPSDENISSGAYPLAVQYFGVIRAGDEEKAGGLFLDWILSEEGQRCVQQAGYIPISALTHEKAGD
ncbi:MAG: substrate-binding domain-containing protein [Firmicutes bacterium]|nr:substrate-binding domain-containing protein [Bacillota bacterium]